MWHPIQRIVFPRDRQVQPLYATLTSSGGAADDELATTRISAEIPEGRRLSFDTYFGALFESHWLAATTASEWQLTIEVGGSGRLGVYRATAGGATVCVSSQEFSGCSRHIRVTVAPADARNAGSRLLFEIEALGAGATIGKAVWSGKVEGCRNVGLAVGICTYNREPNVLDNFRTLLSEEALWLSVRRLIIVEQSESGGLYEAIAALPETRGKVEVIKQGNFGGAGGFTRVILEALRDTGATHVLLMDDDVRIEPECILRTAAFFAIASGDTALGGQMLRLDEPTTMHEAGAILSRKTWRIVAADRGQKVCSEGMLSHLSQDHCNDYGAWFYFAVGLDVVRRAGLPWPFFIVFDDVEYGLRLRRLGIVSTTMPGIAVWHETGEDRDARWKTYYYQRNVLIVNALYRLLGRLPVSARFLRHWLRRLFKRDVAQPILACDAVRDYLRGPDVLDEEPMQRVHAIKYFCAAMPHRQGRLGPLLAAAATVIWLSLRLMVRSRRLDARWREAAADVTSVAWWLRYLRLRNDDEPWAPES